MNDLDGYSDFIFYSSPDGNVRVQIVVKGDTVWTTQKGMSDIFAIDRTVIGKHLKNIFEEVELVEESVCAKIAHTATDGKTYQTNFYNLDAIISVGYRVNSIQATQFRRWATNVLREYLVKGFALDDDRLKQGTQMFGKDYFDELLERIKEIRASERRFYQKVTDIYTQCSIDYNKSSPITTTFFKAVQNKLEFAITHKTAPEIIKSRASALKLHMGLQTWKNSPDGKVLKTDITVAKNYLDKKEIGDLNHIVNMYLDYAELQARNNRMMKMQDWIQKLDAFLSFNEYDLLNNAGRVQSKVAKAFAEKEYKKFRVKQDKAFKSDFDKVVGEIKEKGRLPSPKDEPEAEPLSEHNKNLKTALNYNPKNSNDEN